MAEEDEGPETNSEAKAGDVDAAVALALVGASREKADAFLDNQSEFLKKQGHLVDLQAKELAHELKLRHWSLQVRHVSGLLKLAFEVSLALVAITLACFVGGAVWSAAHADGLIIDTFSVPSDLAAQGLTGEVVASRMLDRLTEMQNETVAVRAPQSYANDWGNDIKVEIPDTGVSFGEAYRYLKAWLGHETHFGGEVVRADSGFALTARISGGGNASFAGTDLDTLVGKASEYVYSQTQSYRYGLYLVQHGRTNEALPIYQHLAAVGPAGERPWGYIGWSNSLLGDFGMHIRLLERALPLQPDNAVTLADLTQSEDEYSHPEKALGYYRELKSVLVRGDQRLISANGIANFRKTSDGEFARLTGDFRQVAQDTEDNIASGYTTPIFSFSYGLARVQTDLHDPPAAHAAIAHTAVGGGRPAQNAIHSVRIQMLIDSEVQDWNGVLSDANAVDPLLSKYPGLRLDLPTLITPLTAYADARLGNIATAEAEIAPTPADCYDCLITRGKIAEIERQHARADWWFDRTVKSNPSIPFAYADWGEALLERGQPDAAIEKFKVSNQKGPHFADPLEGWGEALMAKNRSDLALAKFTEAEKYAPNWGRLHLKWGEALAYAGKLDEAKQQFALAAGLDLTAAEKAELARDP